MLASLYFRAEVRGLENIPEEGPVLLVGNHSGGNLTPDTHVFTLAFSTYFGVERRFYQLAHNLVLSMPGLGILRKYGTVAATPENAEQALDSGAALLVYPGRRLRGAPADLGVSARGLRRPQGLHPAGASRRTCRSCPSWRSAARRPRCSCRAARARASCCGLDRMFRLKVLPISLALPWGLNVGDMLGHIPLPAKITIQVLEPIDVRGASDVDEVYERRASAGCRPRSPGSHAERSLPVLG